MNKSFLDDEETLNEMNEVKNLSINEILHDDVSQEEFVYIETKEEKLEFDRDFIAVSERLMDHSLNQEDAEKKAIISMREYYTEPDGSCKDKEIDAWLKEQENKYQIGSCYFDEDYDGDFHSDDDTQDYEDQGSCYEENEYRDEAYDIPELWCGAGMSDEKLLDVCFETGPDLEIHDKQYFEEQI